jgi:hypothetical protein
MENEFSEDSFTVLNKKNRNILYRTDDLNANELTLSFINLSQDDVTFVDGAVPSFLVFNMQFLKYDAVDPVKDFKFDLPSEWEAVLEAGKKWAEWKLVCKTKVVVNPGKSISFKIKNILCKTFKPGYLYIRANKVPGYLDINPSIGKELMIMDPDVTKDKLPIEAGYTDVIHPINNQTGRPCGRVLSESPIYLSTNREALPIYLTYDPFAQIKNGFRLILTTDEKIVIPEVKEETRKPAIRIFFLLGDYPYQVTNQSNGNDIEVNPAQVGWKVKHDDDAPFWECFPAPQTIEAFTTFSFDIGRIVTQVNAVEGVSLLYVQVNNFGEFADNVYKIQMIKKVANTPTISLLKDKAKIAVGENVKLSWNTSLANKLEIAYNVRDNRQIILSTAPRAGEQKIELTQCTPQDLAIRPTEVITTFVATAYGAGGTPATTSVTIDVTQRKANIRSFKAVPAFIPKGVKTKVMLSWDVADASQIRLYKGEVEINIGQNTGLEIETDSVVEYTLFARSYSDELRDTTQKLKVYTFENDYNSYIKLPFLADKEGERPRTLITTNDFSTNLFAHSGQGEMYMLTVGQYKQLSNTFKLHTNSFAFEHETQRLCYQAGDGKAAISVYPLKENQINISHDIPNAANSPVTMRFSPDGKKLYISYLGLNSTVQMATYFEWEAKGPLLKWMSTNAPLFESKSVLIGFSKQNTKVFYLAYEQKTIRFADYQAAGRISFTEADLPYSKAFLLINANTSENKIYVAFERQKTIVSLIAGEPYQTIDIGAQPFDMVLSPDEKKLYVACIRENKVIVVDTVSRKVEKEYLSIVTPSCLALSKNGELLFVGNHRELGLTIINLGSGVVYGPIPNEHKASGNPISISVLEDEKSYIAYLTKECYSEQTLYPEVDEIRKNSWHGMNYIKIYK